jgi:hypothetical protein
LIIRCIVLSFGNNFSVANIFLSSINDLGFDARIPCDFKRSELECER